jgi:hypothetical protein
MSESDVAGEMAFECWDGHQPIQRRTDKVGADRHPQRSGQFTRQPLGASAVVVQPAHRRLPPASADRFGSAGQPALLPGLARLVRQPVQQPG